MELQMIPPPPVQKTANRKRKKNNPVIRALGFHTPRRRAWFPWLVLINFAVWQAFSTYALPEYVEMLIPKAMRTATYPITRPEMPPVRAEAPKGEIIASQYQIQPSAGVLDAPVGLKAEATRACAEAGFKSLDCRNVILAISYHETARWTDFEGDSGCSTGWVHINRCVHTSITKEATMDAAFAFAWTAKRLKAYGYPEYRTYAISCHNGCGNYNYANSYIKPLADRFVQ